MTTQFKLEHKPLVSLSEAIKTCEGFDENGERCQDEISEGEELCSTHRRAEARAEQEELWRRDQIEPLVSYPSLTDEEEHLR
jgi:hypothetical protein